MYVFRKIVFRNKHQHVKKYEGAEFILSTSKTVFMMSSTNTPKKTYQYEGNM